MIHVGTPGTLTRIYKIISTEDWKKIIVECEGQVIIP